MTAPRPDASCSVCSGPLISCGDSAHPGCAPVDPARFVPGGARTYRGVMAAVHWSICRGCDERIEVGAVQVLADVDGHRVWACEACASQSAPKRGPGSPLSVSTPVARGTGRPNPHRGAQGTGRTDARRAA